MNIFELLGINNPETFVPVFLVVLVIEIILVILVFRLVRAANRKKKERELRRKRLQRLKEIQAAKARKEAQAAKEQQKAEEKAAKERQEAEAKVAKEKQEAEEKAAKERQEAEAKAAKEKQEAEEKAAKERQEEAEERIAKAQKEAQEKIARARQEAEAAFKVQREEKEEAEKREEKSTTQFAKEAEKKETVATSEQVEKEKGEEPEAVKEKPVISVQHVTMIFKVATSNVSGLKEYMIQKVEKKISHRELRALNDVSFDVYKGEVVGIIGTNGSGKSTILRIVSGALRPTSGRVVVDKKKVQLLTLGTGFDYELTAKENVYLNGSIIGYSREFIDQHYDEIVEFAELQDFMEEKVKNFSSGMVSRLGFAIATAGGAAEILILDEVLSVGDEFFRKKSLAKIQEMIHGGSTVLMVSHNMNTIRQNCSKVVWIEKGDLRMIGAPKEVCAAYSKLHS